MANDNFEQQNDTAQVQAAVTAALAAEKKKKKKKRLIIFGVIAVIIIIIIAIASSGSSDGNSSNSDSSNTTSSVNADSQKKDNGEIGNYKCIVKSAKTTKDWTGNDAVLITYEFTNNSDDSKSFEESLTDHVYQDGIELEIATLEDEDADWLDTSKVKPGITKTVKKAYKLRSKTSDVEVEISEAFSFSDDKITTTVKLK